MNIQSIILLVVVVLVLIIDKFFTKNDKQVAEKLIEANKDNPSKQFFSFNKYIFIYCFPLIFVFIGFFINDDLNLFLYEQTGFIYGSLVSWITIFYYVTFFSYKSLTTSKKRDKLIATEILYFFTIIFLSLVIHFSSQFKQNSEDRFVTSTSSYTKDFKCITPEIKYFENDNSYNNNDPLAGLFDKPERINCEEEISTSYGYFSNRIIKINGGLYEYWFGETKFGSLAALQVEVARRGIEFDNSVLSRLKEKGLIEIKKTSVSATITTEYVYDYQAPLIYNDWMIRFDSLFIPFLFNLLIIGYLWRAIFSLVFWSLRTLSKS